MTDIMTILDRIESKAAIFWLKHTVDNKSVKLEISDRNWQPWTQKLIKYVLVNLTTVVPWEVQIYTDLSLAGNKKGTITCCS